MHDDGHWRLEPKPVLEALVSRAAQKEAKSEHLRAPAVITPVSWAPPRGRARRRARNETFEAIIQMQLGECLEVNRSVSAVRYTVYRLCAVLGWGRKFSVYAWGVRTTRIWRKQ